MQLLQGAAQRVIRAIRKELSRLISIDCERREFAGYGGGDPVGADAAGTLGMQNTD